jgi:hypothetical protein
MSTDRAYEVKVELPAEAFRHRAWSPRAVAADLLRLWLVDQVRRRSLGHAKAAELAGMPMASFALLLAEHHVSVFDLDGAEIDAELATARTLARP